MYKDIKNFRNLWITCLSWVFIRRDLQILKTILLLLIVLSAEAQERFIIQGNVSDHKTTTVLPFINIFLEGTTIGTQTDSLGNFTLRNVPAGNYRLVASMIGYQSSIQNLMNLNKNTSLQILLKEDIKSLDEVRVVSSRDKVWESQYRIFEREFLGYNFNKKEVKILNKEVLDFRKESKLFVAKANQPIIIENSTLGYKQTYYLQGFEKENDKISYKGLVRYELLTTSDDKQQNKWEKNRIQAYKGSLKHFLKALVQNKLQQEGYNAYYINTNTNQKKLPGNNSSIEMDFKPQDAISVNPTNNLYNIYLKSPLKVYYEDQYTILKQISVIMVNAEGDIVDPYAIELTGKMSDKRIANSLPFDFELTEVKSKNSDLPIAKSQIPQLLRTLVEQPRETINLTGLQDYYLAGEKIELEASVEEVSTARPSTISIPLYIDLIDLTNGRLVNHFMLKSENGTASLSFPLPFNLSTGNYQIRAYTNWMRNFSEEGFFHKNITIFSQNYQKEKTLVSTKTVFDTLITHIEGGQLISGLKSKIVIQTLDNWGIGINQPFYLMNNKNDTLANNKTDSTGYALLDLEPKPNETYQIKSNNKTFILPPVIPKGIVLIVDNLSSQDKIRVFIQSNTFKTSADTLILALVQKGEILYWTSLLNNKPSILVNIPKNDLNGLIYCLLIDSKNTLVNERSFFVTDNQETPDLNDIVLKDRQLLSQKPSQPLYFNKSLPYAAEKGITLKGRIKRLNGKENKKEVKLSLVLSNLEKDTAKVTKQTFFTEAKEQFTFKDIDFYGKKQVTFIAPENRIELDTVISIPPIVPQKLSVNWHLIKNQADIDKRKEEVITEIIKNDPQDIALNEVKITAKKVDVEAINGISPGFVLNEDRIINQPNMTGILTLLFTPRKKRFGDGLQVFIDTQRLQQQEIDDIDSIISPAIVEKIVIFEDVIPAIYGRATCAIVIKLRKGAYKGILKTNETFTIQGYHK